MIVAAARAVAAGRHGGRPAIERTRERPIEMGNDHAGSSIASDASWALWAARMRAGVAGKVYIRTPMAS
jgi:hypothetical protein